MSTKNLRINITFEQIIAETLVSLAKQERKFVSGLAKELILEALEYRQDRELSAIAESRDVDIATFLYTK